jgi:hypothetical protein
MDSPNCPNFCYFLPVFDGGQSSFLQMIARAFGISPETTHPTAGGWEDR